MEKITTEDRRKPKKTGEDNKNGIKHSWPKGTCVVIGDSMVTGINEGNMSSKRLIKVRTFPGPLRHVSLLVTYS